MFKNFFGVQDLQLLLLSKNTYSNFKIHPVSSTYQKHSIQYAILEKTYHLIKICVVLRGNIASSSSLSLRKKTIAIYLIALVMKYLSTLSPPNNSSSKEMD
jgi:hypothetical protein